MRWDRGHAFDGSAVVMGAHIYWTNYDNDSIGRAKLDGSGFNQNFITGAATPHGVAVDGKYIYWAAAGSLVARAKLDGSDANLNFITGASFSYGMAVNA